MIPKIDCLPSKVQIDVGSSLRDSALTAQLQVPPEACVGPVQTCFEVPVTLEGSCRLCVELPESLADCVTEGRFEVVVYADCIECVRCPIDFVAKQEVKCVTKVDPVTECDEECAC